MRCAAKKIELVILGKISGDARQAVMNHLFPKSKFVGLHFCCRQDRSIFEHFDVVGSRSYTDFVEISQKNGHYYFVCCATILYGELQLRCLKSFKVTDFGNNGKPLYD